ncbi:MFS transporter [Streptomyces sp. VRA16 Mangrove soil]|uniref:MFS transporter n=1 Tax=Streptomyces sp. VRA16 Mangrove soil TaxID=2817434 RepID=UPI001A9E2543|nr:MFS transporter [Streptomyces sp. VRA16 Mangrove soil]MBO1337835.1 MFS transporter [Streptomyces sp. VRA16 Mangrove soil]
MTSTTTAPAEKTGAGAALSKAAFWTVLALVLLADALDMIDSTVTNIAAPTIATDIGGGESLIKWLGAAYALAMGVLLVVGGRLGDKFGQRRLFLIGMTGFTLASAVCGLSPDPALLIVARALQGAFGALLIPQGMAIMTRTFSKEQLGKAFALFGPLLGLSSVGGPILAGFLIDADVAGLSWRPIFLINLILGTVGVLAATRLLPRDTGDRSVTVDGLGSGLLAVTMFGLMLGLIEGSTAGWNALAIGSLAVGLVFLLLFFRRQRTAAEPLITASLLKNKGFTSALILGLFFFAVTSGLIYVISLFMQQGLGVAPADAALGLLPLTLGIIVSAFATMGGLTKRLGRNVVTLGLLLTLAGGAGLLVLVHAQGMSTTLWAMAPAVFVTGLGMGCCFGTVFDFALGDVSAEEAGSASGSLTAIQQLANGLGSAIVTTVYFHAGAPAHAMTVSLAVVLAVTVACLPLVRLLPRRAAEGPGGH